MPEFLTESGITEVEERCMCLSYWVWAPHPKTLFVMAHPVVVSQCFLNLLMGKSHSPNPYTPYITPYTPYSVGIEGMLRLSWLSTYIFHFCIPTYKCIWMCYIMLSSYTYCSNAWISNVLHTTSNTFRAAALYGMSIIHSMLRSPCVYFNFDILHTNSNVFYVTTGWSVFVSTNVFDRNTVWSVREKNWKCPIIFDWTKKERKKDFIHCQADFFRPGSTKWV